MGGPDKRETDRAVTVPVFAEDPIVPVAVAETEPTQSDVSPTSAELTAIRSILSSSERRACNLASRVPMLVHFTAVWAQIVAGLGLVLLFPNVATFAIAFVLIAGGQHGLALVTHEFTHYLVFPKRRKLNDVVGAWFFAGPSGLAFDLYRHRHFAHHRLYSTETDTKTLYKRDYTGVRFAVECLRSLCGLDYLQQVVNVMRRARSDKHDHGVRAVSLPRAMVPLIGSQLVIAAVLCAIDPVVYVTMWAVPLLTLTQLFSKLRSSVEHLPLNSESGEDPDGEYYKGTSGPFARSVRASLVERLFLSKVNFCYHNEHHLWPQVSYQYLPKLRRRPVEHERENADRKALAREATYLSTLRKFWAGK